MSDQAVADEKKWDGKTFPEKLTVRSWDMQGKTFLRDHPDVPCFWGESKDGKVMVWAKSLGPVTAHPVKGSEMVDAAGKVWVVVRHAKLGGNQPAHSCTVEPKNP